MLSVYLVMINTGSIRDGLVDARHLPATEMFTDELEGDATWLMTQGDHFKPISVGICAMNKKVRDL